ncbi:MAG: helix-turn-helix domain-containing protein [Candidatus Riflebacteria bacterium]|nr:helix-turn-helix domain-containing protein [Candidatus Riflebacteria bacterium]
MKKKELLDKLCQLASKLPPDRLETLIFSLEKKTYTVSEAAEIMGSHRETIRRAIRNGRLKAFRIGGDIRAEYHIVAEELEKFMRGKHDDVGK